MTKDHNLVDAIEFATELWVRRAKRTDLWRRIADEAYRLTQRKQHPAPDAETAVQWASVRVVDADARYGHDTGAVRIPGERRGSWG